MMTAKLRFCVSVTFVGAALFTAPSGAKAQGLFDAIAGIFGGGQRAASPARRDFEADHEFRRSASEHAASEARRRRASLESHGGVSGKMQALAPADGVTYGSLQHFAADPTLRSGDVLVTPSGFVVFRGGSFVPVKNASGDLAALQRVSVKAPEAAWASSTPVESYSGMASGASIERVSAEVTRPAVEKSIAD